MADDTGGEDINCIEEEEEEGGRGEWSGKGGASDVYSVETGML